MVRLKKEKATGRSPTELDDNHNGLFGSRNRFSISAQDRMIATIPIIMMSFVLVMLLLINMTSHSSLFVQHIYIFSFGGGEIFLIMIFMLLFQRKRKKY